jgi:hypothetical protein
MTDVVEDFTEPTNEEQRVWEWKVEQLKSLGFQLPDAVYLAASPDVDVVPVARKLVATGCDLNVALQILG